MEKYFRLFFIVFLLGIIIFISRKFLFSKGIILYGEYLSSNNFWSYLLDNLRAWGEYTTLGHSNIGFPTTYGNNPIFFVANGSIIIRWLIIKVFTNFIFGNFESKIYIISSIIFPMLGMYHFSKYWFGQLKIKSSIIPWLGFISGFLYAFNVHIGYRTFAGHVGYNYGFGLLPFYLLFILKSLEVNKFHKNAYIVISGFILSTIFWLMPHIMYMLSLIIGFYVILYFFDKKSWVLIFNIIISGFIAIFLNIDSWLPALFFKEYYPIINDTFYNLGSYYGSSASATLHNILTASAMSEKVWFDLDSFEKLSKIRFIYPITAFIGFIFSLFIEKDKRRSVFIFFIAIMGIIFAMGANYPFEKLNVFLYTNIFLFKPFRDPSKFFMLYVFASAIFIPYLLILTSKISKKLMLFFFILIPIFTIYSSPIFFSGNFGGSIVPFTYPNKYNKLNSFLNTKKGDFRVAIYPNDQRVGNYDWYPQTDSGSPYYSFLTSYFPLAKNNANSNRTISDYSSRYLDYLESNLNEKWAIDRLANEMVRFLVVDKSIPGFKKIESILNADKNLQKIENISGFSIFEINFYNKNIIRKNSAVYYFGDIKGIKYLPSDLALINLGLNPTDILIKNFSDEVVLFDSTADDVFYNSLKKFSVSFFPQVRFPKDAAKGFYVPGEYLRDLTLQGISFYNPEIIGTTGKNNIKKIIDLSRGKYHILLSTFSSENFTDSVKIKINDDVIKKIDFRKKNNTFEWVDFGEIEIKKDRPEITVENLEDGSFYLDYLLIVPIDQYKILHKDFYSKIKTKKIISLKSTEILAPDNSDRNKKLINVFSQSYSPYWKICGTSSVFRVNFFATGSVCENEQNINAQFTPEKLYQASLILTLIFHLSIIFIIIKLNKKNDKTN